MSRNKFIQLLTVILIVAILVEVLITTASDEKSPAPLPAVSKATFRATTYWSSYTDTQTGITFRCLTLKINNGARGDASAYVYNTSCLQVKVRPARPHKAKLGKPVPSASS